MSVKKTSKRGEVSKPAVVEMVGPTALVIQRDSATYVFLCPHPTPPNPFTYSDLLYAPFKFDGIGPLVVGPIVWYR